jgi:hypothetical protein
MDWITLKFGSRQEDEERRSETVLTEEGFVKIHRKILKWEWYEDISVKVLFLHCLILANHTDKSWRGVKIQTGEFVSSLGNLAKGSGLSVRQVRTSLEKLEATNELTRTATNRFSIIKVNNYSTYHERGKKSDKVVDKQATNNRQTSDKQPTTTKNVKNVKKEKKKKEEKDLIFPECIEKKLIEEYFQNRIDIKKAMTHLAKEKFLKKVQKFHDKGQDVKTLIEKAIIAGWSDIYEDKENGKGKNYRTSKSEPVEKAKRKSDGENRRDPKAKTVYHFVDRERKDQGSKKTGDQAPCNRTSE